jgi:hypothetical protein
MMIEAHRHSRESANPGLCRFLAGVVFLKAIRIPALAGMEPGGYLAGVAEKPVTKSHRNAGFGVGLGSHSSTFASSISITGMSSLMG